MIRYVGYDKSGHKRVWGEADDAESAAEQCARAIKEYLEHRPDCAPITMLLEKQDIFYHESP